MIFFLFAVRGFRTIDNVQQRERGVVQLPRGKNTGEQLRDAESEKTTAEHVEALA